MTSYQQTLPHASPVRVPHIDLRSASRAASIALAVLIALIVLAVAVEMTMGYGLTNAGHSPQASHEPVPGLGL